MANIRINRKHNLDRNQARANVEEIAKDLQGKLGANYHWDGNCLCFNRAGASCSIEVNDTQVAVNVKLGLLLAPMKGVIQSSIEEGLDTALAEPSDSRIS